MDTKHGPVYHFPLDHKKLPITISFIGINYCHPNYRNVRKHARITVLGYILSGEGSVSVNAHKQQLKRGDVFILPEGRRHEVSASPEQLEPWSYIWFNISGSLTTSLLEQYKLIDSLAIINASPAEGLFHKAIQMAQTRTAQEMHNELPVLFHQIVIQLANIKSNKNKPYSSKVQKIKDYLDQHFQEPFDSKVLSNLHGLSFKQINRLFVNELQTTVYRYVLTKKLEAATMMLKDTELNINEIAYRLGYMDPPYFSNLFKKKVGVSPSVYRERYQ